MGFKTISLSDAVYRRLRAERRSGESFSVVIDRLLEAKQPPLMKYAGAWKPLSKAELAEIRARIDRLRHGTPAR
jgi:predicted CopG family antitoxin